MITFIFLDILYLIFPLLLYFIYFIYSNTTFTEEKKIFFDLSIISSLYLFYKFGNINIYTVFLANIPLLLALYKRRYFSIVVVGISICFILSNVYNLNVIIFICEYIFITLVTLFSKNKIHNTFYFTYLLFKIINTYILGNFDIYMLLIFILSYVCFYSIIYTMDKLSNVIKMHLSLKEINKEKKLYESLFKITHEIKNPLAVCKGYLDMFDINNKVKANKYVGIINQEVERTLLILKDFSDVSKLKIEKMPLDINMLLQDISDEAKMIFNKNIKFDYSIKNNEVYIDGDYNRLKQVLVNVIKNAKEAVNKSGKVTLKTSIKNNNFIITITDTGSGMDKDTIKKIGTPFYTTKKNGTGLGVCFSKEIIERHNGEIKYYSTLGKGTKVEITLPIKKTSI